MLKHAKCIIIRFEIIDEQTETIRIDYRRFSQHICCLLILINCCVNKQRHAKWKKYGYDVTYMSKPVE